MNLAPGRERRDALGVCGRLKKNTALLAAYAAAEMAPHGGAYIGIGPTDAPRCQGNGAGVIAKGANAADPEPGMLDVRQAPGVNRAIPNRKAFLSSIHAAASASLTQHARSQSHQTRFDAARQPLEFGAEFSTATMRGTHSCRRRWDFMPRKKILQKVIRIHRRPDGRYESRNEIATDSPLGVDSSLSLALGTAAREATLASRDGCRVRIEVQDKNNRWKPIEVIEPPIA